MSKNKRTVTNIKSHFIQGIWYDNMYTVIATRITNIELILYIYDI